MQDRLRSPFKIARNEAWVSVGVDHDTAEFAVATLERWWREMGIDVSICHFPPGTSKWNKIQHRLVSQLDKRKYKVGRTVATDALRAVRLERKLFRGDWNYTVRAPKKDVAPVVELGKPRLFAIASGSPLGDGILFMRSSPKISVRVHEEHLMFSGARFPQRSGSSMLTCRLGSSLGPFVQAGQK